MKQIYRQGYTCEEKASEREAQRSGHTLNVTLRGGGMGKEKREGKYGKRKTNTEKKRKRENKAIMGVTSNHLVT